MENQLIKLRTRVKRTNLALIICFVVLFVIIILNSCQQKDEVLNKRIDSINVQLKTIYSRLDSTIITQKDLLKDGDYNVLIWKKQK
jgi:hypothetical protein